MRFAFEALAETGHREQGEIAATDQRAALKALAARGLTVVALSQLSAAAPSRRASRISAGDRALAVRQLSGLIDGGVTLPNALASVAANSGVASISIELTAVHAALTSGEPIAKAFDQAPKLLPNVERQVVVAGAEAGDLARVLSRLADYFEDRLLDPRRRFGRPGALPFPIDARSGLRSFANRRLSCHRYRAQSGVPLPADAVRRGAR